MPPSHAPVELAARSLVVMVVYRNELLASAFILVEFRPEQVVQATTISAKTLHRRTPAECLGAAILRLQNAMAVTQVDSDGHLRSPPTATWDELVRLLRPRIRAAVSMCGVPDGTFEDCLQETWLEVVGQIHRVDPNPARGNLICWLHTVARRTTWRLLEREARAAAVQLQPTDPLPCLSGPHQADPHQPDPADQFAAGETEASLASLVDSLRTSVSDDAYRLMCRFLADNPPKLSALAPQLGISPEQLWYQWRKAIAFLRKRIESKEE